MTGMVWKTGRDELVCQICGALDGKIVSLDGGRFYDELPAEIQQRMKRTFEIPPAHPACRCRLAARVLGADARPQAQVQPVALSPEVVAANRYVPFDNYRDANDWAEKAYAEFDKSLTKKDNKVIDTYCGAGSHYREWNTALRSGTPLRSELQSATKSLDEIISRATPGRDIVTYRGTRNVFPHDYGELQKLVGTTITDKGYVSTSFNQFRAFDFGGAQDAIMEIRIPKTAKAAYLNPSESEIVLPRNTQFKVVETRIDQEDPEEPSWMVVVLEVLE